MHLTYVFRFSGPQRTVPFLPCETETSPSLLKDQGRLITNFTNHGTAIKGLLLLCSLNIQTRRYTIWVCLRIRKRLHKRFNHSCVYVYGSAYVSASTTAVSTTPVVDGIFREVHPRYRIQKRQSGVHANALWYLALRCFRTSRLTQAEGSKLCQLSRYKSHCLFDHWRHHAT
jgi:hypothetical protein